MNQRFELHLIFLLNIVSSYVSSQTTYTCSINASCGCSSNSAVITKIVGGESATSQTWGWMASIRYSATGSHFCGGSIISTYHILTAAHCVSSLLSPSSIRVYIGSIYLSVVDQTRSVSKIFVHANYSSETYVNDIAILKLSSALDLDQRGIDTICLPNVSAAILASQEYPTPNTSLIGIGWGYMYEASNSLPDALQQVTVQALAANNIYCRNLDINDSTKQFCAGVMPGGGKDTCSGDSGGPLMMFNSMNVWEIVGITSSGVGCARENYPGVYTRVAAFQIWINATMNDASRIHVYTHTIFSFILAFISLTIP